MNTPNNLNREKNNAFLEILVKKLFAVFLLIIIAVVIITNTLVVQEDELVVITQFGRVVRILNEPGLNFKLPIVQSTNSLTKKLLNYEAQPINAFSKDKKNIIVTNYAVWRISEPQSFISKVQTIGSAEALLESTIYSVVRDKYSLITYDEIIKGMAEGEDFNEEITSEVMNRLQGKGIEIVDVRLKRTELPADEEEEAYAKIKADRERISKEYITMAENEASQIKAEADKQAKIVVSQAYEASEEIKGKADAEAAKIYAASYNKDPEFYKFIRTLESYKKTLKGKTTIIIPIDSPYTKYLIGK